jgi:DNA-binding SARP family transcriptional activator
MQFRILGPLEAEDRGRQLDLGGPRQRSVLAFLLLYANQPVPSERLLEALWGSPSTAARNSLQSTVSRLRQLLVGKDGTGAGPARITSRRGAYQVALGPDELDSLRFERLLQTGQAALEEPGADPAGASTTLEEALGLWRGEVLADLRSQGLDEGAMARLDRLRQAAVEAKAKADLTAGREADVIREVPLALPDDRFNERLYDYLMRALVRTGRAAEAVEVYQDFKQLLDEERGMRPSRELQQLHLDIKRQEVQEDYRPPVARPQSPPDAAPTPTEEIFVGREAELGRLQDALAAARAGQGRLILIGGEMGIGKSYLARRLAAEVKGAGLEALWGRVWEEEGAPIYWPWLMILRQLLDRHDPDWLRQRLGADAAVVAQVVPEVAERLPGLSAPPRLESTQDRFRLFDSLTEFLKRAVSDRPLVLVLDDLHRADDSSLLLLRFLTRGLGDARLLVVATYRDSRADQNEQFVRTLAELTREPVTSRLVLRGFDKGEVARFVELAASVAIPDAFAARLHDRTSGNPLFLKEMVLSLADGRDPTEFERGLDDFVPQGVQEAVERRLAYIPAGAREVLDKASVIGQQFTLEVLAEVTGLDGPQLLGPLDQVMELDYVTLAPDPGANRFRFAHVLIRDALFRRLSTARRAVLHQRVGEALEKVYADDLEGRYIELAHHFLHAAGDAGSQKSLDYLQLAGKQAVARYAYADAVQLFEGALQQPTDRSRRCDLLLALADAQMKAASGQRARSTFMQAADTAKALGDQTRFARAALGFGGPLADFGLVNEPLIALLEEALGILNEDELALRARVLGRLADALYWVDPERRPGVAEERARLSAEGVRLARRAGDPDALAAALHGRWYATWRPDNAEERRTIAAELHEVADGAGNWELALLGRMWSIITALELGDMPAADAEIDAYAADAEALGQQYLLAWPALWRGTRATMQGRFAAAEELNRQALALSERAPDANLIENAATLQHWFLDDERGRREALEEGLEGFTDRFPDFPSWRLPLALMRLAAGEPGAARAELDSFAASGFGRLRRDANWLATMTLLAEICAALGEKTKAPLLYEQLTPYSERCVVIGFAAVCRSSVSLQLGQLATLLGRWEAADQYFSAAMTANRRVGARPALTHTRYRYARALLERGRGDDPERAQALLEEGRREAAALGMIRLLREIESALDVATSPSR